MSKIIFPHITTYFYPSALIFHPKYSKSIFVKQKVLTKSERYIFPRRILEFAELKREPSIHDPLCRWSCLSGLRIPKPVLYSSCSALLWCICPWSYYPHWLVPSKVCRTPIEVAANFSKLPLRAALKMSRLCSEPSCCKSWQSCESETILSRWY